MKTQIRKYGNSTVIILDPEFIKYRDIKIGDWVDISDIIILKEANKNETKKDN